MHQENNKKKEEENLQIGQNSHISTSWFHSMIGAVVFFSRLFQFFGEKLQK